MMTTYFDLPLVLLSFFVAVFASFVALDISSRLSRNESKARVRWILTGGLVLGLGIWAMHFIGMLAFHPPSHMEYDVLISILSILPAIVASGIAFWIISYPSVSQRLLWLGALFIATGIASMHYYGMEAMVMEAVVTYDPLLFALSLAIAFAASFAALSLLFRLQRLPVFHWRKIAASVALGLAIAGMHYTGMAAMTMTPLEGHVHPPAGPDNSSYIGYGIGVVVLLILVIAFSSVRAERRLADQSDESERKFQSVIETANDAIIVADEAGTIRQWNQGAQMIFGYSKEEAMGQGLQSIIPERFQEAHKNGTARFSATRVPNVIGRTVELTGRRKDGTEFPLEMSLGFWESANELFFSSIIRDITERKKTEEQISHLVYRDALTGLPNRRLFNDRLASILQRAADRDEKFAILYLNVDHFKLVNDSFGHIAGDGLLVEMAHRLQSTIPPEATLSRFGGDEFVFLLPETDAGQAAQVAQLLLNSFERSFHVTGEELVVTPSIGVSIYPADGADAEALIKNAHFALYRVKENGKNHFQFHTTGMNEETSRRSKLAIDLRKAVEQSEIAVHYQPQIDIPTGHVVGVEALLRWTHPQLGFVSPGEFIPIAEETGTIIQLGEFVLREACRQNKAWQDTGLAPFRVAVNISAKQFMHSDLVKLVGEALAESGLAPEFLELELTESAIQQSKRAASTMEELKRQGVFLSIDDFGTGYSSLSYLKDFPIDKLKIDQYFMRHLETDPKDAALADTIIRMARNLHMDVIAEGVETAEQLDFLKQRGCDLAQGYFYSRPVPACEIVELYGVSEVM